MIAAAFFLLAAVYYTFEYKFLGGWHFYLIDLCFAAIFVWRMFFVLPKDREAAPRAEILFNTLMILFPLTYVTKYFLNSIPLKIGAPVIYGVLFLVIAGLFASNLNLLKPKKRIILEHTAKMKGVNIEPFSVFLTKDFFIPGSQRFLHEQVIGASGTGKTYYIFKPHIYQDIKNGAGLFIYDIKSNMRPDVESYVAAATRDYDLYTFSLGDPGSDTYNPLANGTAMEISNRVYGALFENSNEPDFFKIYAKEFLSNAIALLKAKFPIITFADLYLLAAHPTTKLKKLCIELDTMNEAQALLKLLVSKDLDDRLIGLKNKLSQFSNPKWTDQINTTSPDISMEQILSENKILLFQANSGLFQDDYKPISILALKDLQTEIGRRYQKPPKKPFAIYLDEFYNIIYKGFVEMINKAREAKVMIIFGHQSLGDLELCGMDVKNAILTNSAHKIVFNVNETNTAEYFNKYFGTRTIERDVKSRNEKGEVAGTTDRLEDEFIFNPNDIKNLKTDSDNQIAEAIISIKTSKGKIVEKIELKPIGDSLRGGKLQKRPITKMPGKRTNLEDVNLDEEGPSQAKLPPVVPAPDARQPAIEQPKRRFKRKGIISAKDIAKKFDKAEGGANEA